MKKNKYNIDKETPEVQTKAETPKKETGRYTGARYTGRPLFSTEFGMLEKDKIYPIKEDTAKASADFEPVYE